MKIVECEEKGLSFEEVVSEVEKYIEEMNTFFVLENLETLRKNGRLGRVKALVASALKIKPVMGATPEGTICQLDQARGMNKAIVKMVDHIGEKGINIPEKTVAITHCNCPERAKMLEEAIREKDWITREVNHNTYFKDSIPLLGYRFNFVDVLKTFVSV